MNGCIHWVRVGISEVGVPDPDHIHQKIMDRLIAKLSEFYYHPNYGVINAINDIKTLRGFLYWLAKA